MLYGFVVAYILNPIFNFWERVLKKGKKPTKEKGRRILSLTLTYLCALTVIGIFLLIITPNLTSSVNLLANNIKVYSNNLSNWIEGLIDSLKVYIKDIPALSNQLETLETSFNSLVDMAVDWISTLFPTALDAFTTMVKNISVGLSNVLIGIIVSVYMLSGKEKFIARIKRMLLSVFKEPAVERTVRFSRLVHETVGGFIVGKLIDSLIIGLLTFIVISIFGISFPLLISVIVGVTNIIPFFGPFIGAIPSIFILLMIEPMQALIFAILILIIQQIDGNIIGPKILGKTTGISAIWVVVAILIGNGLFGFWGMLLGVPVCAVLLSLLNKSVDERLEKKGLPYDDEYYHTYMHEEPRGIINKSEGKGFDDIKIALSKLFAWLKVKLPIFWANFKRITAIVALWLWKVIKAVCRFIARVSKKLYRWIKKKRIEYKAKKAARDANTGAKK